MTRNRRMTALMGGLGAFAAGSPAVLPAHLGNLGEGIRGLVIGITAVLSIFFVVRAKQED